LTVYIIPSQVLNVNNGHQHTRHYMHDPLLLYALPVNALVRIHYSA